MIELQFQAESPLPLIDVVRQAGAADGTRWSRRKVVSWIEAGCVRVEDAVVRDPRAAIDAGQRVDLRVDPLPHGLGAAGHAASSAPLPILHVDRHLLIVEILPGAHLDLETALRTTVQRLGLKDAPAGPLVLTSPPHVACTGLVGAALTASAAEALDAAHRLGEIRLIVDGVPAPVSPQELAHLAPSQGAATPPHVVGLRLPHPRHGAAVEIELGA